MTCSREGIESVSPLTRFDVATLAAARAEAKSLFRLIARKGETADALRELIGVSPQEQRLLEAFAAKFPELSFSIQHSTAFRLKVAEEFERLVIMGSSDGAIAQPDGQQSAPVFASK